MGIRVFTPKWFEENARLYNENTELQDTLRKLTVKMGYHATQDTAWGLDEDVFWCTYFENGVLNKMATMTKEECEAESDFVLVSKPATWSRLLRRTAKFGTELTIGRVKVEKGSKLGVLKVAPYSKHVVTLLTQADTNYPDE